MDVFDLEPEEEALLLALENFSIDVLARHADSLDKGSMTAFDHLPQLAEQGIMGMNLPEACGGVGLSRLCLFQAVATLAQHCAATASMVTAHFLATDSLLLAASPPQQKTWLNRAAEGRLLGAFALTEPAAGSNPADMKTKAERSVDGFTIKGTKHFITNAEAADFFILFARQVGGDNKSKVSAFIVDSKLPGIQISPREVTMGLTGSPINEVSFDCRITADCLLGEEGKGLSIALGVLDRGRIEIAAMACGIAQAALGAAIDWSRSRSIGGRPLSARQAIQFQLADMETDLEAARLLGLQASHRCDQGRAITQASAMAKLYASEAAGRICDQALQIHGGYGYSRRLPLERHLRDVRILRIYEGASEIQRQIIARSILG